MLVAASFVFVCALLVMARQAPDAAPTSDTAVIESFTLLASQGELLLGPYSRFQWHHPGPLASYWMAPFYVLSGEKTSGLYAGALVLNLACLFALTRILARRASPMLMTAITGSVVIYLWRAGEMLASPWNPHMPVVALLTLAVATADVLAGSIVTLPLVAALASLAGQTHVGLLPVALMLGALAVAGAVLNRSSVADSRGNELSRPLVWTLAVLLICWAPPLVEQVTSSPGNLTQIFDFFVLQSHPGQTFANGLSAWADMLSGVLRPDFYTAHGWKFVESPVKWAEALAIVQLAGIAMFGARSAWTGSRFGVMLATVLLASALLGLWSALRIEGAIFDHEVFWLSSLGALNIAVLAALLLDLLAGRLPGAAVPRRLATGILCLLIAVPAYRGTAELRHVIGLSDHPAGESVITKALAADLHTYIRANRIDRPLIVIDQDTWGITAGVILRLQKDGVALAVEDDWLPMFTPVFKRHGGESTALTIAGKGAHVRLESSPDSPVVISRDPMFVHRSPVATTSRPAP